MSIRSFLDDIELPTRVWLETHQGRTYGGQLIRRLSDSIVITDDDGNEFGVILDNIAKITCQVPPRDG